MRNQGLGSWIHRRRVKSAGRTAIIGGATSGSARTTLTYDELAARIDRLAAGLAGRGVGRGDRVAFLGENHPSFLETMFACGVLGAIFVPLNTRWAPPEVQFGLSDSGSTVLIHSAALADLAQRGSSGTEVTHRIVAGDASSGISAQDGVEMPDGVERLDGVIAAGDAEHRDLAVTLDDPAMILYTSGTTGRPKGAVLTHGNLTWNAVNVLVDHDVKSTDVALMIAPMFHVAALGMGVLPTLLKGATVLLEEGFDPGRALALIEQYRVTTLSGVPTTFQMLSDHPAWDDTDLSSMRMLTCGGSAVPMRVLEAYESRGMSFSNGYGMTETSPGATTLSAARSREKAGSSGLAHFFSDMRVVGPGGEEMPPHEPGEIQLSGPNVIGEYWRLPEATAESRDGEWFRSGDIGYLDNEGFLYVSDRLKDMIISGGENIYPAEVEQAIAEMDAVAGVAVIGVPDDKWGERPRAFVVLRSGYDIGGADILAHLDGKLARYKIPTTAEIVDDLPRTASGKIRKAELRKRFTIDDSRNDK